MYKETITYTDFDGHERTEDFYFNLTKAEVIEMELGEEGGLTGLLQRIIDAKDTPDIIREIKRLLLKSYGKKTPDGRSFMKSDEIRAAFECSEPYSVMFMKLSSDDEAAAAFANGIMPPEMAAAAAAEAANGVGMTPVLMPPV